MLSEWCERYPMLFGKMTHSIRAGLLERIGFQGVRPPAPAVEGRFVEATHASVHGARFYKAYLPSRGEGRKRPLVVMLHGCKQNPDDFAAGTRMNELADELGFIVVYPRQARAANASRCWNWFRSADQKRDGVEPSLIAGITREAIARYDADPRRIYIAGLSAGGAMAAIMGHTHPDLYAAIGIHSGLAYGSARDLPSALAARRGQEPVSAAQAAAPRRRVPTIVFHGDEDSTVHPSNGRRVIARATPAPGAGGAPTPLTVERGEARGLGYTRTAQADPSGRPLLEHWIVHGAGHAWSGGSGEGSYADPRGPEASREMLRFFLRFSLTPPRLQ